MNYGYASDDAPPLALSPDEEPDRYSIHLYERTLALTGAWLPRFTHPLMRRFAAVEGSRGFTAFASGRTTYVVARLRKPVHA